MNLSEAIRTTGSLSSALMLIDTDHRQPFNDGLFAHHLSDVEFDEMLAERSTSGLTDYRIRHDSPSDMLWHPKYSRLVRRSTAERYDRESSL